MDKEIALLETRVAELLDEYQRLRGENRQLQARVAELESENQRLASKVDVAVQRVERVLAHLPASEDAS